MNDLLQQGITAYKAGKRDEARKIFIAFIKQNPENEHGWGWMYQASGDDKERIYCLKQMLRINPKNEKASQLLDKLLAPPLTLNTPPSSSPQRISHPQPSTTKSLPSNQNNSFAQYTVWGLALFLFVAISVFVGIMIFSKQGISLIPSTSDSSPEVEYSRKTAELSSAFVQANSEISDLQGQLSSDMYLIVDPTWQANYFAKLDKLESVCKQIGALPPPPSDLSESDYWLRLLATECDQYISNERTGVKYGDTNALDMAGYNLANMLEYFHNAANALPK
jgi:tetratricopeptide (TPR) repeat protein